MIDLNKNFLRQIVGILFAVNESNGYPEHHGLIALDKEPKNLLIAVYYLLNNFVVSHGCRRNDQKY
jgi:hypothetical protein